MTRLGAILAALLLALGVAVVPAAAFADGCGFTGDCDPSYPDPEPNVVIQHAGIYSEEQAQANFIEYMSVWGVVELGYVQLEDCRAGAQTAATTAGATILGLQQQHALDVDAIGKQRQRILDLRAKIRALRH